ncbi:MAG: glycosyltransferase family 4 protein, partial [candidate division WOR-3 bacterium]
MKVLHITNIKGGGIGTFLKILERKGEIIWEMKKQKEPPLNLDEVDTIILHGYISNFNFEPFKNKIKIYYFQGLREVSKRMILNKFEFNPYHILKLIKFRNWLKNFDYFISVSFSMSFMAKKFYNVNSFILHSPLDFDSLPKMERNKNENVLLWIGRNAWIKGLNRFLELMKLLPNYEGWVLGVEGKNYNNIKFFGYVNNVYEFINKAKAIIITSYYEAFPFVCLESLYYGVPVLTLSSAGGAFEILQLVSKYEWCFDSI